MCGGGSRSGGRGAGLVQAKRGSVEESEEESSVDEELVVHGQWLKGSGSWLHACFPAERLCLNRGRNSLNRGLHRGGKKNRGLNRGLY